MANYVKRFQDYTIESLRSVCLTMNVIMYNRISKNIAYLSNIVYSIVAFILVYTYLTNKEKYIVENI